MTYYEILEVREDASQEVINMAYKALCRKYHPDVYKGFDNDFAAEMMTKINEAYEVLSNQDSRSAYDKWLILNGEREDFSTCNSKEPKKNENGYFIEEKRFKRIKRFTILFALLTVVFASLFSIWFFEYDALAKEYEKLMKIKDDYRHNAAKYAAYYKTCVNNIEQYYLDFAYITEEGTHYHKLGCPYIGGADLYVNYIKELERQGYDDCSFCYDGDFRVWIYENPDF